MPAQYQPSRRVLAAWVVLLALAQMADLVTTGADMSRGGIEANGLVVGLMAAGGLGLVAIAKLSLVLATGLTAALIHRNSMRHPSDSSRVAHAFLWRSMQASVLILVVVALHNTALLAQMA